MLLLPSRLAPASLSRPPARRRHRSLRAHAVLSKESRVTFEGVDGERLVGTLRLADPAAPSTSASASASGSSPLAPPPLPPKPPPLALLAHGYMSHRDTAVLVRLADALASSGLASLRWDFGGNGESGQGRFRYGDYRREALEISAAAAFCRGRGFDVVALAGHSKGATSSVVFAGSGGCLDVPRGLRVVNMAGRFDVSEGVERRLGARVLEALRREGRVEGMPGRRPPSGEPFEWTLFAEDLEDRLSTDVGAFCAAAGGLVRVLSIHCEGDTEVPVGEAARLHAALGGGGRGHRLVVLRGGDHSFREEGAAAALVGEVVAWCAGGGDG